MVVLKWLYPGMKIKRWLFLALASFLIALVGVDLSMKGRLLGDFAHALHHWEDIFLGDGYSKPIGIIIVIAGLGTMVLSILKAFHSIAGALAPGEENQAAAIIYARQSLKRGPKIVVIGGGTGLSVLLRGLKKYTSNLTAIVTVADDGGSSGRLRGELGILPPGDIRNCLVALADKEPLMEELLQYRFSNGGLAGHSMGNLLLAALADITGRFDLAVRNLSKVLAIRGQVLPATLSDVTLYAELTDGRVVKGESKIPLANGVIKRVYLKPSRCLPLAGALAAIAEADAIVLGPGSLYTSIIPNLLVKGIPEALARAQATKIYVCNVMTQPGETVGYTASAHLQAIINHTGKLLDYVILNNGEILPRLLFRYRHEGAEPVKADISEIKRLGVKVVSRDFIYKTDVVRHHPDRLAGAILELVNPEKVLQGEKRYLRGL